LTSSKSSAVLDSTAGTSEVSLDKSKIEQISCENGKIRYNVMGSTFDLPK